jgi:3-isopropylmalate dehydrogenase
MGDRYAVFQPCHGTAPTSWAAPNPTAMICRPMMLDWLADKHGPKAPPSREHRARGGQGLWWRMPMEFGGGNGTADITGGDRAL